MKASLDPSCVHPAARMNQKPSHFKSLHGGFYLMGKFDSDVYCRDCGIVLEESHGAAPRCRCCHNPMEEVKQASGNTSELLKSKEEYQAKVRRVFNALIARESASQSKEGQALEPLPANASEREVFDRMHTVSRESMPASMLIMRRSNLQQVWPYMCSTTGCVLEKEFQWLHTPGD